MNDHHTRKGERTQMTQIPNEQDVIQSIREELEAIKVPGADEATAEST